ncbi:MAG TPA: zinc finger domain-containing protein, partial [Rhizomicrobium sp.]|nr:zinc finger domain-containing protein [Rhizomicrobium sp.]
ILESVPLAEIMITSTAHIAHVAASEDVFRLPDVEGVAAKFEHARGNKCARCWMILEEVGKNPKHDDLCNRCSEAVDSLGKA